MSDFRYKAYLSYSHSDQKWAEWLHKYLEAYRIPGRLRKEHPTELPESLAPIFRDREDLPSASDLGKRLNEALAQSEALLVICSPASAASEWVNEEIRQFRRLHGDEKIFCIIVDGDPQAPLGDGGCFPPALIEAVDGRSLEPLAADPREFADGKRLAVLKIVSGLLGVRLDDIRRREHARKRRKQLIAVAAAVGILTLGGFALSSKLAQQQERAQAEQMASFIVDLGEDLRGELDVESLGRISSAAMRYLDQLDPNSLSLDSRIKVGTALRQVGNVNWDLGELEEAKNAFDRSLSIYRELNSEFPENDEVWFQLSQAEFYAGYVRIDLLEVETALTHFQRYKEIAEERHEALPEDKRWVLEYSYANSAMINIGIELNETVDEKVLQAIDRNLDLAGRALVAWDNDSEVMIHYLNELAWAADAQISVCRLDAALSTRTASMVLNKQFLGVPGMVSNQEQEVARREQGLANVHFVRGELDDAADIQLAAVERFEAALRMDPSNETVAGELANALQFMAQIQIHMEAPAPATEYLERAAEVRSGLKGNGELSLWGIRSARELPFIEVSLAHAQGDPSRAQQTLKDNRPVLVSEEVNELSPTEIARSRIHYRYEMWRLTGLDPARQETQLLDLLPERGADLMDCRDADMLARHDFMTGDLASAQGYVSYLAEAGYREPGYIDFCQSQGLCAP